MKILAYFVCLFLFTGCMGMPHTTHLGQFGMMIKCLLGKSVIEVGLDYIGYGCYCGFGGDGEPLDDTDRCCQVHDDCYTAVQFSGMCRGYNHAYIIPYNYQSLECGTDRSDIMCMGESSYDPDYPYTDCAMAMCACDKAGAECFHQTRPNFNPEYIRYFQKRCLI